MEFPKKLFQSVSFLVLLGIVGFSLMLQMPSLAVAAAAFSCDPSTEVYVGGNRTHTDTDGGISCYSCPGNIQNLCNSKGRTVSKIECNWWDIGGARRTTVCVGCCGELHPPPIPVITGECQAGEANQSFQVRASFPWNCGICQNGCKDKCDFRKQLVSRELCGFVSGPSYDCKCCCRPPPPPPSPPPPPPSPPPPRPSPPPPPPPPPPTPTPPAPTPCPPSENTCDAEDLYLAFQLPRNSDCYLCAIDCKAKCSTLGTSVATECCIRKSSAVFCKCCCTDHRLLRHQLQ
ncbi:hypothetical protein MKW92_009868 [Papaver armeniacum]|nr:hypothetical protein MKW92_009868 [Papaver armeniacum]